MIDMSDDNILYTVGEVAERFSLTVRTLHHWEAQGSSLLPNGAGQITGSTRSRTVLGSKGSSSTERRG